MYYIIDDIKNLEDGGLYADVRFWPDKASFQAGDDPVVENFMFPNLKATGSRVVKDGRGFWKTAAGDFIDPDNIDPENEPEWERESFDFDIKAILLETVERYYTKRLAVGQDWPKNHADHSVKKSNADPRGLRKPEVEELKGKGREK